MSPPAVPSPPPEARVNMGLCLYYLQQPMEALRFMERCLAVKPDYARAREWRNRLRAETGG